MFCPVRPVCHTPYEGPAGVSDGRANVGVYPRWGPPFVNRTLVLVSMALFALPLPAMAEGDQHSIPATFSVAPPMQGDAGSYERSIVSFDGKTVTTIESPKLRESFRIEAPRDTYDRNGQAHRTNVLHQWIGWTPDGPEGDGGDIQSMVDATSGELVATQYVDESVDWYVNTTYFPSLYLSPQLCGLENALQRQTYDLSAPVRLFAGSCRRAYYMNAPGANDQGYVAVRADPWGDTTAVGFQQSGTGLVVLAWFVAEIPYPVRLLEQLDSSPAPRFAMLDLVGFERGTLPAAGPGDKPVAGDLDPVDLEPHHGVGPSEDGVDHPFPWSAAWSAAQADADVRIFLDAHPDAVVRQAVYNGLSSNTTTTLGWTETHAHEWWFTLDDGDAAEKFATNRTTTKEYAALPLAPPVLVKSGTTDTTDAIQMESASRFVTSAPPRIPTVASATKWWEALATPHFAALGSNGWLHALGCTGCDEPWAATGAGFLGSVTHDNQWRWEASYVSIGADGAIVVFVENIVDSTFGPPHSGILGKHLPLVASPLAGILSDALSEVERLADAADVPAVPPVPVDLASPRTDLEGAPAGPRASRVDSAVAGKPAAMAPILAVAEGLALAAGAAALLWKLFAAGLFSRLRRDRALDHPVRRAIHDAIEAEPGIHLTALLARTGKAAGVVRHHLGKLEEAGLVTSRKGGGYLCYFAGKPGAATAASVSATKSDGARRVLQALSASPLGIRPLATRAGLAPSTVEHHLARLETAGLVRRDGKQYAVTRAGLAAS